MSRAMRLFGCVFLLAAAGWASGCASLDLKSPKIWPFSQEDEPRIPAKMVAMWSDAVSTNPNGPPQRGFGGRLTFYDSKADKPVKVDGTLVVYVFDEEGRDPGNAKPDRKYVFGKEDLQRHYSKSDLGHSYSVWLPWDEAGGPQKEVSLIVRFTPNVGPTIVGEQARQILPGVKAVAKSDGPRPGAAPPVAPARPGGQVELASHEVALAGQEHPAEPNSAPTRRMTTTTIRVPSGGGNAAVPVADVRPETTRREPAGQSPPESWTPLPPVDPSLQASSIPPSPQARSSRDGRPAQEAQAARPGSDRGAWQLRPGESSYPAGRQPSRDQRRGSWSSAPADPSVLSRPGWAQGEE
ncbi:MAG: hypothetical protein NTW96_14110, partial [Planctomycetia bacterium]|nr:hypothetical protein [Planctomycetia bacterium]